MAIKAIGNSSKIHLHLSSAEACSDVKNYTNALFNTSFGMNKEIIKGKLYFAMAVNNPATKFRNMVNTITGPDFMKTNINQTYYRAARLNLNCNFGKLNGDLKKNKKGINNNNVNNGKDGL